MGSRKGFLHGDTGKRWRGTARLENLISNLQNQGMVRVMITTCINDWIASLALLAAIVCRALPCALAGNAASSSDRIIHRATSQLNQSHAGRGQTVVTRLCYNITMQHRTAVAIEQLGGGNIGAHRSSPIAMRQRAEHGQSTPWLAPNSTRVGEDGR